MSADHDCDGTAPRDRTMWVFACCILALISWAAAPASAGDQFARLHTDAGEILLIFDRELAPHHVEHFLHLARTGFYDGTSFHRIVPDFVIQGGDPNSKDADPNNDGQGGPRLQDVLGPEEYAQFEVINRSLTGRGYVALPDQVNVRAEFSTTAQHRRGVLSMARARANDSAGSQFFICVADRFDLDGKYTVFGYVVSGMDVVDAIVSAPRKDDTQNPIQPVRLRRITILSGESDLTEAEHAAWREFDAAAIGE